MQRRACIASRMLSSSVVIPRQTARAGKRPRVTAKTKPSPSISGTAHAFTYACASQCADTSVLFILKPAISSSVLVQALNFH